MGKSPAHGNFFAGKSERNELLTDTRTGGGRSRLDVALWKIAREARRICRHAGRALGPGRKDGKGKNLSKGFPEGLGTEMFFRQGPDFVSPAHIRAMISDPAVKIVSFDVFDTLLVRPALQPRDIFHLLARRVNALYGVDFIRMRWDAEAELGRINADIHEIYDFMAEKHGLDARTRDALLEEEVRCETTLLSPRPDAKELYDEAVRLGKRVIAVSDMYLPGEIIADILRRKGFSMDAVYVSCDCAARKSDGALYDVVLAGEGGDPSEILHVGDNWESDYVQAIRKRLTAVWLPSVAEMCRRGGPGYEEIFADSAKEDPMWSLYRGFSLNRVYGKWERAPAHAARVDNLRRFAELDIAPLLTAFCIFLVNDREIRASYGKIHFASRDGWLPYQVYSHVRAALGGLPGEYFMAGRRAYYPFLYRDFFEFAAELSEPEESYTLHDLLKCYFSDSPLYDLLENSLSEQEKGLQFFADKGECLNILRRFEQEIAACLEEKRHRARAYYRNIFGSSEKRYLVFDLGYSGSIGKALSAVTGKPVDKIYFWSTEKNEKLDFEQGTRTRVFMGNGSYAPYNLLLEELFSSCEGGCIGFTDEQTGLIENIHISDEQKRDMHDVHSTCIEYAEDFMSCLGEYAQYAVLEKPWLSCEVSRFLLKDSPFCNLDLFHNIIFPDPVYRRLSMSLQKKMEYYICFKNEFYGTGFDNPTNVISNVPRNIRSGRVGIHIHLYNHVLSHEIVRYLQDFPVKFDMYVTITDGMYKKTIENIFNRAFIPLLENLLVFPVPNRGRDIAPWILGMRPYHGDYEIFCHIHGKESSHFTFGEAWRKYLFDNLIQHEKVETIIDAFCHNPGLGCLFPPIFGELREFMLSHNVSPFGVDGEEAMGEKLLARMGLNAEIRRSELFFSPGTMLWYRPEALRQMFTFDLRLEEFGEEPITVGGDVAHALERLPSLVASRNGYMVRSLSA